MDLASISVSGSSRSTKPISTNALSQALRKVHAGPQKLELDEDTRWQIADEAIEELRRHGGWKELDEEAPMRPLAPGSGPHDRRETLKVKPEKK